MPASAHILFTQENETIADEIYSASLKVSLNKRLTARLSLLAVGNGAFTRISLFERILRCFPVLEKIFLVDFCFVRAILARCA